MKANPLNHNIIQLDQIGSVLSKKIVNACDQYMSCFKGNAQPDRLKVGKADYTRLEGQALSKIKKREGHDKYTRAEIRHKGAVVTGWDD